MSAALALKPVFFLLAGPNGAGKSTLYRAAVDAGLLPADAPFVTADIHEAQALQHVTDLRERSLQAHLGPMPGAPLVSSKAFPLSARRCFPIRPSWT